MLGRLAQRWPLEAPFTGAAPSERGIEQSLAGAGAVGWPWHSTRSPLLHDSVPPNSQSEPTVIRSVAEGACPSP